MESALMVVTEPRETRLIADLALDSMVVAGLIDQPGQQEGIQKGSEGLCSLVSQHRPDGGA
jgi:hypothetical protein